MKNYILFDHEAFMQSIGHCDELALEIIEVFLGDAPRRNQNLADAITENSTEISHLAHAIKGITSVLRLAKVSHLASEIERAESDVKTAQLAELHSQLSELLAKSIVEIKHYMQHNLRK